MRNRPVIIVGAGARDQADNILRISTDVPIVCSWGAIDCFHHADDQLYGAFGTHGSRAANYIVQNANYILSIGCRLDTKATGTLKHFARDAEIDMIDIDDAEVRKFAKMGRAVNQIDDAPDLKCSDEWIEYCNRMRAKYKHSIPDTPGNINPYRLMIEIAKFTTEDDIIVSDTGTAIGYVCKAFPFKGERLIHPWNMTPMGYGLSGAIGAYMSTKKRVIAIVGDGGIMMSLSEMATIARHKMNIKIILLDNNGHAMCRQTQRQWLGGQYPSTSIDGGLGFPDFEATAEAFGILDWKRLQDLFHYDGPGFMCVEIHPDCGLEPQAKFGQPIEDADPQVPWDEHCANMIIKPLERT